MNDRPIKPLGMKAYGSIGHLPCSRIGPGDHFVHEGQQVICTTKARKGDRIIVTEKLDGACMAVANVDGEIISMSRAGYRADQALYDHLKLFGVYVRNNDEKFRAVLQPGERIVGEWLAMAHGTLYDPNHPGFAPFIAFDLFRGKDRVLRDEFMGRVSDQFQTASLLWDDAKPLPVEGAMNQLREYGYHGATEPVEGAVWRVEREGRVDFLAKFVRHNKVDGKYLPNISNAEPIWYWKP